VVVRLVLLVVVHLVLLAVEHPVLRVVVHLVLLVVVHLAVDRRPASIVEAPASTALVEVVARLLD
jgi:hypothetical protein